MINSFEDALAYNTRSYSSITMAPMPSAAAGAAAEKRLQDIHE